LWEAVKPLGQWAQSHVKHIARARAAFDKKNNAQPVADISSEQRIGQVSET
jgi:hypothetical protein